MDIKRIEALEALVKQHGEDIDNLKKLSKQIGEPEFDSLKALLESEEWPAAVDPALICDISSDQDKEDRAEGILDVIVDTHLEGLAFLDFGCGTGHVVNRSLLQNPRISVGYDIQNSDRWKEWPTNPKTFYTSEWNNVEKNGPYDVILIYDVLDHMKDEKEVLDDLKKIRSIMSPKAKVFVRCHPWCSRHGTHLYHKINKAFVHLVFTDEELKKLNYTHEKVQHVIHPLITYENWFRLSGFKQLQKEQVISSEVEPFFQNNPLVTKRIKSCWSNSMDRELQEGRSFPLLQLKFQFIDYVLI